MRKPLTLTASVRHHHAFFIIAAARPATPPAWKPLFNAPNLTGWTRRTLRQLNREDGLSARTAAWASSNWTG